MKTFAQLLSEYIIRLGISDAELARTIGVRRQTIFRWREGVTARPRHRDDVLRLAEKLRLTPEERDELLLSAGFAPQSSETLGETESPPAEARPSSKHPRVVAEEAAGPLEAADQSPTTDVAVTNESQPRWRRQPMVMGGVVLLFLVVGLGILGATLLRYGKDLPDPRVSPTVSLVQLDGGTTPGVDRPASAQVGETLILITNFVNYAGEQIGYNIAGRLAEALEREVEAAELENIRVAVWTEPIATHRLALQAGQAVSATLIIYGEYDAGRVVAQFAHPAAEESFVEGGVLHEVTDLQALSAAINGELPQQVRSLALLTLGQIYIQQGQSDQARQVLQQAHRNLKGSSQVDERTWGTLNFFLGIAYHQSEPPQPEAAIMAYTEALKVRPGLISARLNRSSTYLTRRGPGDLELALVDADEVIRLAPDWAVAYSNRASILMALGEDDYLARAEEDLNQALKLDSTLAAAYINRAILQFRQGQTSEVWRPDVDRALALEPEQAAAYNMLCWGYAVEAQADQALPYCEQAIALDQHPSFIDSRGLAQALLDNYPAAIADFETFIAWLEAEPPSEARDTTLAQRRAWVEALQAGENPFTPEVLAALRRQ